MPACLHNHMNMNTSMSNNTNPEYNSDKYDAHKPIPIHVNTRNFFTIYLLLKSLGLDVPKIRYFIFSLEDQRDDIRTTDNTD